LAIRLGRLDAAGQHRLRRDPPSTASMRSLRAGYYTRPGALIDNFDNLGFAIVGVFMFAWIASVIAYRYARLDDVEPSSQNR
jgi:nickel/cobalt transporter (NiCoT) family protein